jgi:hypothetical protein
MSGTASDPQVRPAPPKPHPPKQSTTTAHWRTALLISAVLAALLIALSIADVLVTIVNDSFYQLESGGGSLDLSLASSYLAAFVGSVVNFWIPLAAGVLVSLKFLAPVASDQSIATVLLRGLIATAVGAVFSQVAVLVTTFLGQLSLNGPIFGATFPQIVSGQGLDLFYRLSSVLPTALHNAPTVVLIVILGWLWMRRAPLTTAN